MILGLYNICLLHKIESTGSQLLTYLFYIFALLELLSAGFTLVWYLIDPTLTYDSDDPRSLLYIKAALAPTNWGLFMVIILTTYYLGISLQVILREITSR